MFRWFCFLTIDDGVFDHSTISYFIERIGNEGFGQIFQRFNEELLRLGLLSRKMYADSSLVRANVSDHHLAPNGMSVEEFKEKAVEENGLFALRERIVDEDGVESERVSYYRDPKGRLPLSEVDTDARWRTTRQDRRPKLDYQENVIVDRGGFIVSRRATHASGCDWRPLIGMLGQLPVRPDSLPVDTGYNDGRLRNHLGELGITAYIPIHPNQEKNIIAKGGFGYRGGPPCVSRGQEVKQEGIHQEGPSVHVRCSPKGLPAVSGEDAVSTAGTEATVCVPECVSSPVPESEGS